MKDLKTRLEEQGVLDSLSEEEIAELQVAEYSAQDDDHLKQTLISGLACGGYFLGKQGVKWFTLDEMFQWVHSYPSASHFTKEEVEKKLHMFMNEPHIVERDGKFGLLKVE